MPAQEGAVGGKPTFATFDVPSAGTFAGQGTYVDGISTAGAISGTYADSNDLYHGFVRAADGTITTFDAPGADQGTFPNGASPAGAIMGYELDASWLLHGFVRAADGTITTFEAPGAGTNAEQGTSAYAINAEGQLQETTWTRTMGLTASCAPPMAQ
jgi:predicted membrane protein